MDNLLEVRNLHVQFRTAYGTVKALSDASFTLKRGEILVIVGESGCGKTVLAHALLRLLPMNSVTTGSICVQGQELLGLDETAMRRVRGQQIALIPQSPGAALNPVRKLGPLLLEIAQARQLSAQEAQTKLQRLLAVFDLDFARIAQLYPHQLSGGMQQRVVNALALVGAPDLIIADEPTAGLDATLVDVTAAQLQKMQAQGAALLVITHDLRLAERLGGRLALMYASYLVELRDSAQFFAQPAHPYGRGLLAALPERGGQPIPGLPVELSALPQHCTFAARCPERFADCTTLVPPAYPLPAQAGEVKCLLYAAS